MNLDRKYCQTCQKFYPSDMVKLVRPRPDSVQRRWRCTTCIDKRSTPNYKGEAK